MSAKEIKVMLDDEEIEFIKQKPRLVNGVSLAPISVIFEKMGYSVEWKERTKYTSQYIIPPLGSLTMKKDDTTVYIEEHSNNFETNGEKHEFPEGFTAMTIGTNIMIPVRGILESVGCVVGWDQENYTVIISTNQRYTVTFNANGGSIASDKREVSGVSGTSTVLPMPIRSSYKFEGWYTAVSGGTKIGDAGEEYIINSYATLYAHWSIPSVNDMMENFKNSSYLSNNILKKDALIIMGTVLADHGYEPAFIAGVLGYIQGEGNIGHFESSNYSANEKPWYLEYVDEKYNYNNLYSNKYIYNGIDLYEVRKILNELEELPRIIKNGYENYQGGFGLGCCQWTFARTLRLINRYIEVAGESNYINYSQTAEAEAQMMIYELEELNDSKFKVLYSNWYNACSNEAIDINSAEAAYLAGYRVLFVYGMYSTDYSNPNSKYAQKANFRGNYAKNIFSAMTT